MTDDRIKLTAEQALSLIADGEDVHVIESRSHVDVHEYWDRCDVIDELKEGPCEVSWFVHDGKRFGVDIERHDRTWHFATKPDIDWAAEEAEARHRTENRQ